MKRRKSFRLAAGAVSLLAGIGWHAAAIAGAEPATVYFVSADGKTRLVGYLFAPSTGGPHPAVVMLHGRAGLYSSNVNTECTLVARERVSPCNATSLSKRNAAWGAFWAERGYVALLPDSFGPRGRGHGFGRFTHGDPEREDVNERTVRPLDAEGALDYLRSRMDVVANRIYLQGWSNGASTTLNVMYRQAERPAGGFRAALAFYPGCGPRALISQDYRTAAPLTVLLASDDEEVSPATCHRVLDAVSRDNPVTVIDYAGATHGFDDPGRQHQSVPANRAAREDAFRRAAGLFANQK
jgi:carboxymethylenebutenolidase